MKTFNLMAFAVAALSACAEVPNIKGSVSFVTTDTIDDSYVTGGGRFDGGPSVYVVAKAKEYKGNTVLCGVWTNGISDAASSHFIDSAVEGVRIELAGETLLEDATRFPRLTFTGDVAGSEASCMATGLPWQATDSETQIDIVPRVFMRRIDQETIVRFVAAPLPRLTDGSVPPPSKPSRSEEDDSPPLPATHGG